jgi:hypothetical protein
MKQIEMLIDSEKEILILTVTGNPDADDYKEVIQEALDKHPQKHIVWDHTEADLSNLSSNDLEEIMRFVINHPNTRVMEKIAMILPSDLSYGLGRMFEIFGELQGKPWDIQPFRSSAAAFQWIGIEDIRTSHKGS